MNGNGLNWCGVEIVGYRITLSLFRAVAKSSSRSSSVVVVRALPSSCSEGQPHRRASEVEGGLEAGQGKAAAPSSQLPVRPKGGRANGMEYSRVEDTGQEEEVCGSSASPSFKPGGKLQ